MNKPKWLLAREEKYALEKAKLQVVDPLVYKSMVDLETDAYNLDDALIRDETLKFVKKTTHLYLNAFNITYSVEQHRSIRDSVLNQIKGIKELISNRHQK